MTRDSRPWLAVLAAGVLLLAGCGLGQRARERATEGAQNTAAPSQPTAQNPAPPGTTARESAPTGQAAAQQAGNGLLGGVDVLVPQQGGRADWGRNSRIVFSKISDLSGRGQLSSEIYAMQPDGSGQTCLTCDKPEIPHRSNDIPIWQPNGDYIVFESADPSLSTFGLPPQVANRLEQGGYGYNNNLWAMTTDGSQFFELTHIQSGEGNLHPRFSPDGKKLFWSATTPGRLGGQGWVLKLADFVVTNGQPALANVQTLSPLGSGGQQVYESHDFSPDGSTVLFSYSKGQPLDLDIYRLDLASGRATNLTNTPGVWDEHAYFSPDGAKIAWVSSQGYPFQPTANWGATLRTDLWMMDPDGSNKQQVTFFNMPGQLGATGDRSILAEISWGPNGDALVAAQALIGSGGSTLRDLMLRLVSPL